MRSKIRRNGSNACPVLCIHGSAVPWKTVQGVRLVGPRGLKKLITKAKLVLSENDVQVVAEVADRALRLSGRDAPPRL